MAESTPADEREPNEQDDEHDDDGVGSFQTYLEYNQVLRTWFVAFGVGGPVLFLINKDIATRLAAAHELKCIVELFLIGVSAQVFGALLNKFSNLYLYGAAIDKKMITSLFVRFARWWVDQFWIDLVFDVITFSVFGYAAWQLLTVFAKDN